jgi:hypothetical protein
MAVVMRLDSCGHSFPVSHSTTPFSPERSPFKNASQTPQRKLRSLNNPGITLRLEIVKRWCSDLSTIHREPIRPSREPGKTSWYLHPPLPATASSFT